MKLTPTWSYDLQKELQEKYKDKQLFKLQYGLRCLDVCRGIISGVYEVDLLEDKPMKNRLHREDK
jgi:hypothetical protein